MARLNEILVGRFNRGLQKVFGIKGGPPVATLAPEIMPTHWVFGGNEQMYLIGWQMFGMQQSQAAVAANFSQVQVRNPPGSNVLAVFTRITVANNQAAADQPFLQLFKSSVDLATPFAQTLGQGRLDARGQQNSTLAFSKTAAALIVGAIYQGCYPINGTFDFVIDERSEIPLLPGDALLVCSNTANQVLLSSWYWRERFLEDSERT